MKAVDFFKILLCFDAAIAAIVLCGFVFYLVKGPVSPSVTGTWLFVLLILLLIIAAGIILKSFHYNRLALLPMLIVAAPGIIYLSMMVLINVFKVM